jgi:phytoene/squalene synthetase
VLDRAEEYRRLAAECLQLANQLPAGQRANLMQMAQTWQRLADEQEHATDLRTKKD